MKLIDKVHFVVGAPPANFNTAIDNTTYALGEYVHMGKYSHITIVIMIGAAAGATGAVTVKQALSAAGGSAKNVTIGQHYICTGTSTASDTWVRTAVTSNTWTMPATANLTYIIEIDARALDNALTASATADFPWLGVNIVSTGGTNYGSVLYILSEPRYISAETAPTAIS